MNYWIFTVKQRKNDNNLVEAETILKQRLSDKFWGLGEKTPNRRALKKGDQIVFYVGMPQMTFSAIATLDSDSFQLTQKQNQEYSHGMVLYENDYGVKLDNIQLLEPPRFVKDILGSIKFIENKENWGAYFQGGVRQLSEDDYRVIISGKKAIVFESPKTEDEIVSESQFALEAHLEEFIDKNWKHIDFGQKLNRYETDEQDGRQFPAGTWSIDFLCTDAQNGDFVVIELKRGKTSDATVGQILRYIGWVSENLAQPNQTTRGIIIAQEVDEAMRYAIKGLPHVKILTYKVDFKLTPFKYSG